MWRVASLLTFWILLCGCQKTQPPAAERPLPVRLAYTTQLDCALVPIAIAKGFFEAEGVALQPTVRAFGKEALDAVLSGEADLATVAETPVMFAVLQGKKISILTSIFTTGMNHAIVADRERGISRAEDLRGKRVGFTPGTTSEFFLSSFLTANNVSEQEVTRVDLLPSQMRDALRTGAVDAVSAWQPQLRQVARELGGKASVFYDPYLYTEFFLLAGPPDYVHRNQEAVRRVLRALLRAEQFAARQPAEAQAILAASGLGLDPDIVRECWSESRFQLSIDHALLISLEEETRWALNNRASASVDMPNYLDYIDTRPLRALKPGAVNVEVVADEVR